MSDLNFQAWDSTAQLRLSGFLDQIGELLGRKDRRESFALYALGLLGDSPRKSAEPMAARLCPDPVQVQAMHFRLCNFLRRSEWADAPVRLFAASFAASVMHERAAIESWIIDDTGFIKQGKRSPGVQRQYTGSAGKITNCQVGVSLTLANSTMQLPIDFQLFLPESWANDRARCQAAHIPDDVAYKPKWQLALDMLKRAADAGLPRGIVLADSDYGDRPGFRLGVEQLGLTYSVAIHSPTTVQRVHRSGRLGKARSVEDLALSLLKASYRNVTWREGSKQPLASRCATIRVRVDDREQWLLIEWPKDESKPTKYGLSTQPPNTSRKKLFRTFKERWRTERVYQDLKGQLGLDHFEGRSFTGWHHHITVALCCYAFCVAEHARSFPPAARRSRRPSPLLLAA